MFQEAKVESIVNKIRKIYFVLICLGVFGVLILLGVSDKYGHKDSLGVIITLIVYLMIYFGLRLRKKWVIPFVLISSAFGVLRTLLAILQPAEDIEAIIHKFMAVIMFLFYAYQLKFFSKREVRAFFRSEGIIFF